MTGDQGACREFSSLSAISYPDSRSVTAKVGTIVQSFIGHPNQALKDLARRGHLPLSTAHRLVHELVMAGLLQRGENGRYTTGTVVRQLGRGRQSAPDAQARIGEVLDDLALVTGQRARFGVLCGHALGVSYLQRPDGGHSWDGDAYERPALLPAHATAVGKALLAHAPPPVFDRLLQRGLMAYTAHTPTSEERLRQEILTTLKRGVAISQGEWHDAKLAVATPVFGPSGLAIGALELTLPGAGDLQAARSVLIVAARGLSRRLVEIAPYLPAEFGVAPLLWRDLGGRSGRQSMTAGSSTAAHRADTVSPSA